MTVASWLQLTAILQLLHLGGTSPLDHVRDTKNSTVPRGCLASQLDTAPDHPLVPPPHFGFPNWMFWISKLDDPSSGSFP